MPSGGEKTTGNGECVHPFTCVHMHSTFDSCNPLSLPLSLLLPLHISLSDGPKPKDVKDNKLQSVKQVQEIGEPCKKGCH